MEFFYFDLRSFVIVLSNVSQTVQKCNSLRMKPSLVEHIFISLHKYIIFNHGHIITSHYYKYNSKR
ncbi:hypothetical protein PUN28_008399 [Cardiocondyla obscurior]|uniref:Uncharacterized protein n=1 Tax=Cardiocondyla obscurior TaxID=286306 RepID=A0AAW2FXK8_9HYME